MSSSLLVVQIRDDSYLDRATSLANALSLPLVPHESLSGGIDAHYALAFDESGLSLHTLGAKAPGPIRAEFAEGSVDHRRKFGGGKGQMIAKAVGLKSGVYPKVLDATAGLGKDAFVLATLGCQVQLVERSPIVHALLADGLERGLLYAIPADPELHSILSRMTLLQGDSLAMLDSVDTPDVVYLDPMFPERQKSAEVKKEMAAFHSLVGGDEDADGLLDKALSRAVYRVVVKRPRKSPFLANRTPSFQLEGKSSRYDIYTNKKMPDKLPL